MGINLDKAFAKLPEPVTLTGTEKQIAWASEIRATGLARARVFIQEQITRGEHEGTSHAEIMTYADRMYRLYQEFKQKVMRAGRRESVSA